MVLRFKGEGLGCRVLKFGSTVLGGPHHKKSDILGSMLGSSYVGKLPLLTQCRAQDLELGFRVLWDSDVVIKLVLDHHNIIYYSLIPHEVLIPSIYPKP